MKLSFRDKQLMSFDAAAVALEATELSATAQRNAPNTSSSSSFPLQQQQLKIVALDISHNKIQHFMGTRCLPYLETLDASHNVFRQAMHFPASLTKLDVSSNRIESLVGLDTLLQLQVLDASRNQIEDLGRLPGSLQLLNLSHNQLRSAEGLGHLMKVTKLQLHRNEIATLAHVASLGTMKALRHLTISENPVTANAKLVQWLESEIPKLTTLDSLPLSQAHASMSFRLHQSQQQQNALQTRARAVKMARHYADAEGTVDGVVEQELRTLNARVQELEKLATSQYETEVKSRRDYAITRQQLHRTEEIAEEQRRELSSLHKQIDDDQSTLTSLERTLQSLEKAFQQRHALIVSKKLER